MLLCVCATRAAASELTPSQAHWHSLAGWQPASELDLSFVFQVDSETICIQVAQVMPIISSQWVFKFFRVHSVRILLHGIPLLVE